MAEGARAGAGSAPPFGNGSGDKSGPGRVSGAEQADPKSTSRKSPRKTALPRLENNRYGALAEFNNDIVTYMVAI
jgi:hypothetical protein